MREVRSQLLISPWIPAGSYTSARIRSASRRSCACSSGAYGDVPNWSNWAEPSLPRSIRARN